MYFTEAPPGPCQLQRERRKRSAEGSGATCQCQWSELGGGRRWMSFSWILQFQQDLLMDKKREWEKRRNGR